MNKITPFLWFDNNLEEAIKFYTSVFKNSKVSYTNVLENAGPDMKEKVMTASFELEGQSFMAINGGPMFKFTEAISFYVNCDTQEE